MNSKLWLLLFLALLPLSALSVQGCSGGGGGGGVAPVVSEAPAPVTTQTFMTGLGLQGNENVFPVPLANTNYLMTRSGFANLTSGTVTWHPQNGAVLWASGFNSAGNQGDAVAWVKELEIKTKNVAGDETVVHFEDFANRTVPTPISGAWYSNTTDKWFNKQETSNSGVFKNPSKQFGVPIYIGDPSQPQQRDQVGHVWITPFPRVQIPSTAVEISIRAKFHVLNGALFQFGLDRWETTTNTVQNQTQAQAQTEEVMLSQVYDDGGSGNYNITICSPIRVLPSTDPNPLKKDPNPAFVTPISNAVLKP